MARYDEPTPQADGWTDWITPEMRDYRLACCDCGLVHRVEFNAVRVSKPLPDDQFEYEALNPQKYRVEFRVRRDSRATGQMRRKQKKK